MPSERTITLTQDELYLIIGWAAAKFVSECDFDDNESDLFTKLLDEHSKAKLQNFQWEIINYAST